MFEKVIHYLHLNILSHISCTLSCDNLNSNEEKNIEIMKDDILSIMNLVTLDLKASFNHISSFKKRYTNFKNKRFEEIELQNTITTIALFLLKEKKLIIKLIDDDSLFLYDLINYISTIVSSEESNKNLFYDRILKEAIHELGHTFSLKHCQNKKCVMCFSNNIEEVDIKKSEFCEDCEKMYKYMNF